MFSTCKRAATITNSCTRSASLKFGILLTISVEEYEYVHLDKGIYIVPCSTYCSPIPDDCFTMLLLLHYYTDKGALAATEKKSVSTISQRTNATALYTVNTQLIASMWLEPVLTMSAKYLSSYYECFCKPFLLCTMCHSAQTIYCKYLFPQLLSYVHS